VFDFPRKWGCKGWRGRMVDVEACQPNTLLIHFPPRKRARAAHALEVGVVFCVNARTISSHRPVSTWKVDGCRDGVSVVTTVPFPSPPLATPLAPKVETVVFRRGEVRKACTSPRGFGSEGWGDGLPNELPVDRSYVCVIPLYARNSSLLLLL